MRTNHDTRELKTGCVQASTAFGISFKDQAHIMSILRDTLYTDRIMAVLREYSSNAWDAHRDAGKGDVPIKVTIPTTMEPTLIIRDFGHGMSDDEVFRIYTQYGASTKRDTDEAVGMLGIGSKSAFAYSDSFIITSWNGGMKRVYVAVLDETDVGEIKRLTEEPCENDETGIEIKVPVQPRDIWDFESKAKHLYKYFDPRPEINIKIPTWEKQVTTHGFFNEDRNIYGWVAVMGCVAYRINVDQIKDELEAEGVSVDTFHRVSGALFFEIGDVHISANREELKYSDTTKQALARKFNLLQEAYVDDIVKTLTSRKKSDWDKRMKILHLKETLRLPIPTGHKELTRAYLELVHDLGGAKNPPKTFRVLLGDRNSIPVTQWTKLVLVDDQRPLGGFSLGSHEFAIKPSGKSTLTEVRKELDAILKEIRAVGIPTELISTRTWEEWRTRTGKYRTPNKKHTVNSFKIKTDAHFRFPWSDAWEIETRVPTEDDVYIVMERFQDIAGSDFYNYYSKDRDLVHALGETMPAVYGYKYTAKNTKREYPGQTYNEWRKKFFKTLLTDERKGLLQTLRWANVIPLNDWEYRHIHRQYDAFEKKIQDALGEDHLMCQFLANVRVARADVQAKKIKRRVLEELILRVGDGMVYDADVMQDGIYRLYPLLKIHGLPQLAGDAAKHWFQYMEMSDRDHLNRAASSTSVTTGVNDPKENVA